MTFADANSKKNFFKSTVMYMAPVDFILKDSLLIANHESKDVKASIACNHLYLIPGNSYCLYIKSAAGGFAGDSLISVRFPTLVRTSREPERISETE